MSITDRRGVAVDATDTAIAGDPNPGLAIKAPVRVATTAAVTLSGLQTIDGIALADGDRVLVKDQADQRTNGLYNAATGLWQRTIDATSNDQWTSGTQVIVTSGTANIGGLFRLTTADPVTIGTSNLTFTDSISAALLPTPTTTTLGGVKSLAAVTHQFLTSIGTDGLPVAAQPAFADISGTLTAAQEPSTTVNAVSNDTNVTGSISAQALTLGWTGTLAAARLNPNVVQNVVNDTNITGSISAQTLTLGWTGTLGNSRLTNSSITISGHALSLGGALSLAQADISGLTTADSPTFAGLVAPSLTGGNAPASTLTLAGTSNASPSGDYILAKATNILIGPSAPSNKFARLLIKDANSEPSIVSTDYALFALEGGSNGTTLAFGVSNTSPDPAWIQSKNFASNSAQALSLQPAGGGLAINATAAGIMSSLNTGIQVGDSWNSSTYSPPSSGTAIAQLTLWSTSTLAGIISNVRTSTKSGTSQGVSSYAFADNATARGAWPWYSEGHRLTDLDYAYGLGEATVVNRDSNVAEINPFNTPGTHGGTLGLVLETGNQTSIASQTQYSASAGLMLQNNLNADQTNAHGFAHGIVFRSNALDSTLFNPPDAIALAAATVKQAISFWGTSSTRDWLLYSDASAGGSQSLKLSDALATITGADLTVTHGKLNLGPAAANSGVTVTVTGGGSTATFVGTNSTNGRTATVGNIDGFNCGFIAGSGDILFKLGSTTWLDIGSSGTTNRFTTGDVQIDNTTDSSSASTGSLHTAGGIGAAKAILVGTNLWHPTVANGSVATALSSVGPTGAHTSVQEWFPIKNASGTTRYVPGF